MPTNKLPEFISRLASVEAKIIEQGKAIEIHLAEGVGVKNDIAWLKKAFWTIAAAACTGTASLVVGLILYLVKHSH